MPIPLIRYGEAEICLLLALGDNPSRRRNSVATGGTADIIGRVRSVQSVAIDPNPTSETAFTRDAARSLCSSTGARAVIAGGQNVPAFGTERGESEESCRTWRALGQRLTGAPNLLAAAISVSSSANNCWSKNHSASARLEGIALAAKSAAEAVD